MTRKEATSLLKSRVDLIKSNYPEIDDYCEALEMAVEALKQEPCEDCISREALLTSLEEPMNWTDSEAEIQQQRDYEGFIELVKSMPSVVEHTIQGRK